MQRRKLAEKEAERQAAAGDGDAAAGESDDGGAGAKASEPAQQTAVEQLLRAGLEDSNGEN